MSTARFAQMPRF